METVSYAMPSKSLQALLKEMQALPGCVIERTATTRIVKLVVGDKSREMLRAMKHSRTNMWLVRAVTGLVNKRIN